MKRDYVGEKHYFAISHAGLKSKPSEKEALSNALLEKAELEHSENMEFELGIESGRDGSGYFFRVIAIPEKE